MSLRVVVSCAFLSLLVLGCVAVRASQRPKGGRMNAGLFHALNGNAESVDTSNVTIGW
jgi:hypothetical protein